MEGLEWECIWKTVFFLDVIIWSIGFCRLRGFDVIVKCRTHHRKHVCLIFKDQNIMLIDLDDTQGPVRNIDLSVPI